MRGRNTVNEAARGEQDYSLATLREAIAFLGLITPLVILGFKIVHLAIMDRSLSSVPFLFQFGISDVKGVPASWLVLLTLFIHVVRLKLGIAFISYDRSYLGAFERHPADARQKTQNAALILAMVVLTTAMSVSIAASQSAWITSTSLGLLAAALIWFDVLNWQYLFRQDVDRKGNLLIVVGDLAFLFFVVTAWIYQVTILTSGEVTHATVYYYALLAWSVLEISLVVLLTEGVFTYADGVREGIARLRELTS